MMWGYSFNWISMTLMMLGSSLWIVFLIVLAWVVIRWLNQRTPRLALQTTAQPGSGPIAIEILSQRYARGEIDAKTFEQMREALEVTKYAQKQNFMEARRTNGERLFDGRASDSEILYEREEYDVNH